MAKAPYFEFYNKWSVELGLTQINWSKLLYLGSCISLYKSWAHEDKQS